MNRIGLRNNIYDTLFPHLRKPPLADGTRTDAPALIDEQPDLVLPPDVNGAQQEDPTGQVQFFSPQDLGYAAPEPEKPAFDPNDFQSPKTTVPQGIVNVPTPSFDTSAIEAAITKTPYQKAKEVAENVAAEPIKKQAAWKQALWIALQGANKVFNPQDNTPVQWLGEAKHNKKVAAANAQLAPLEAIEQRKIKQAQEIGKIQKANADFQAVMLGNEGKVISNAPARGKQEYETLQKKDFITPEEAAAYTAKYGIPIQPYDARKFDTRYENGVPFMVNEKGAPNFQPNPTLPVRMRETEVPVTIGDQKGYATSKDGLNMKIAAEQANANRQVRAKESEQRTAEREEERQYRTEKEFNDDVQRWEKETRSAKAKLAGATTQLAAATRLRAELNAQNLDTGEIDKQILQAEKDIAEAKELASAPKPRKAIKPQSVSRVDSGKTIKLPKSDPLGIFK